MRPHAPLVLVLLASPALAHIVLEAPANFQVVDAAGNPNKLEPCGGAGTATNAVTNVLAGGRLTVTWTEPIMHPGHFRLALARDPLEFVTPTPQLNQGGANCQSAPIARNPAYPVLEDGLFVHTTAAPNNRYSTTITVPDVPCENCTLQLMQFMSSHAPPCFYFQCAKLRIIARDAGVPLPVDAGSGPVDAGADPGDAGTDVSDAGVEADGGVHVHEPEPVSGCGCTSAPVGVMALVLLAWAARRRAR